MPAADDAVVLRAHEESHVVMVHAAPDSVAFNVSFDETDLPAGLEARANAAGPAPSLTVTVADEAAVVGHVRASLVNAQGDALAARFRDVAGGAGVAFTPGEAVRLALSSGAAASAFVNASWAGAAARLSAAGVPGSVTLDLFAGAGGALDVAGAVSSVEWLAVPASSVQPVQAFTSEVDFAAESAVVGERHAVGRLRDVGDVAWDGSGFELFKSGVSPVELEYWHDDVGRSVKLEWSEQVAGWMEGRFGVGTSGVDAEPPSFAFEGAGVGTLHGREHRDGVGGSSGAGRSWDLTVDVTETTSSGVVRVEAGEDARVEVEVSEEGVQGRYDVLGVHGDSAVEFGFERGGIQVEATTNAEACGGTTGQPLRIIEFVAASAAQGLHFRSGPGGLPQGPAGDHFVVECEDAGAKATVDIPEYEACSDNPDPAECGPVAYAEAVLCDGARAGGHVSLLNRLNVALPASDVAPLPISVGRPVATAAYPAWVVNATITGGVTYESWNFTFGRPTVNVTVTETADDDPSTLSRELFAQWWQPDVADVVRDSGAPVPCEAFENRLSKGMAVHVTEVPLVVLADFAGGVGDTVIEIEAEKIGRFWLNHELYPPPAAGSMEEALATPDGAFELDLAAAVDFLEVLWWDIENLPYVAGDAQAFTKTKQAVEDTKREAVRARLFEMGSFRATAERAGDDVGFEVDATGADGAGGRGLDLVVSKGAKAHVVSAAELPGTFLLRKPANQLFVEGTNSGPIRDVVYRGEFGDGDVVEKVLTVRLPDVPAWPDTVWRIGLETEEGAASIVVSHAFELLPHVGLYFNSTQSENGFVLELDGARADFGWYVDADGIGSDGTPCFGEACMFVNYFDSLIPFHLQGEAAFDRIHARVIYDWFGFSWQSTDTKVKEAQTRWDREPFPVESAAADAVVRFAKTGFNGRDAEMRIKTGSEWFRVLTPFY